MTDTRPLYRPEVTWLAPATDAVPPLDRSALIHLRDASGRVAREVTAHIPDISPENTAELDDAMVTASYATGIADVLSWLVDGAEPEALAVFLRTGIVRGRSGR